MDDQTISNPKKLLNKILSKSRPHINSHEVDNVNNSFHFPEVKKIEDA